MTTTTEPSEAQYVLGRRLVAAQARVAAETPSIETATAMTSPVTSACDKDDGAGEDEDGAGEGHEDED